MSDPYRVAYHPRVVKQLRGIDRPVRRRIHTAAQQLGVERRPAGCRKLAGYEDLWRIQGGSYRVIYTIEDDRLVVLVLQVGHRKDVYEQLSRRR